MKAAILVVSAIAIGMAVGPAASQAPDIRTFVRQVYIEGVPFQEVERFNAATAVPVLLEMLADAKEEEHWPNVVVTLGMLGDVRAVDPLIQFVEKEARGTLSQAHYIAKTSAVMSLGYIVNKGKSDKALAYLTAGLDPDVWTQRGIKWSSPYHPNQADLRRQLITMSILGLGLSGTPKAVEVLRSYGRTAATPQAKRMRAELPNVDDILQEALKANERIARSGLAEYYQQPPP
jgi:hypothetical protein